MLNKFAKVEKKANNRKTFIVFLMALMKANSLQDAVKVYNETLFYVLSIEQNKSTVHLPFCKVHVSELIIPMTSSTPTIADGIATASDNDTDEAVCFGVTAGSLKGHSPFSSIFSETLTTISEDTANNDSTINNELYNPSAFNAIQSVIYLFPLWSSILQHDIFRFAENSEDNHSLLVDTNRLQCKSNAVVESHVKGLKYGRLSNKKRV